VKEFIDFLSGQPPFDALTPDDLARLATHVEVEYFAAGATVVRADERLDHILVIRAGALEVIDAGRVVDLLLPGDTVGHIALLSQLPHGSLVRAHEESLCLRIADPRTFLAEPQRLSFARIAPTSPRRRLLGAGPLIRPTTSVRDVVRPVVWSHADERIADVARRISEAGQSPWCAPMAESAS
jgi:CBS domain-containing protein